MEKNAEGLLVAKRFPVLYPMPFGEEQYRKYLELAREPMEIGSYIQKAWNEILPENPRICKKHADEGFEEPLESCSDCMRYNENMIEKTVANLVRCGFLKKNRGYTCQKHNRIKKGKIPKPIENCPDCRPYKERICDFHKEMGVEEPDSNCSDCKEGYISLEAYPNGKKWLNGELKGGFSHLVFESLKIGWGYQLRLPNAINAVMDILSEFSGLESGEISGSELYEHLAFKPEEDGEESSERKTTIYRKRGGYDLNYAGEGSRRSLREILKLLVEMEVLKKDGRDRYSKGDKFESRKIGLKKADMFSDIENIIKNIGSETQILPDKDEDIGLKALLSKYYIYVQCGGIGKEQWFLRKIYKALFTTIPKSSPIEFSMGRRNIIDEYKISVERATLREKTAIKWKIDKEKLYGLNIGELRNLMNAASQDDVDFLHNSYSSKFDKSILDKLCHDNGLFNFPKNFEPYRWQKEAVIQWISGEGKERHEPFHGIVSVVTGAGKTVMALLAIKEYFNRFPDAKVSVIVPTRVLMHQWAHELSKKLAIPSIQIGLRGDDFKDINNDKKIMILIVNSAIQDNFLRDDVFNLNNQIKHFLIADECHRYTGEKFQKIFECRHEATLGLSATPIETENIPDTGLNNIMEPDSSVLIKKLGPIYYELNYRQALNENLISEFTVNYIGVELTYKERSEYDNYTKELSKVLEKIRLRYGDRLDLMSGTSLNQKLQIILKTDEKPDGAIGQYFILVRQRRNILYDAINRKGAYLDLLDEPIKDKRKVIVFHERIDQLEDIVAPMERRKIVGSGRGRDERKGYESDVDKKLEALLLEPLYRPVMYHSGHEKDFWNQWAMDWFRDDTANIMLSVKALIEGVDVPAADVGIVRVSSSSVRQRIQATGRILRRMKDGEKKHSNMYIIFVRDTVDENIFKKYDWRKELGSSDIKLQYWHSNIEGKGEFEDKDLEQLPKIKEYEDNRPPIEVEVSDLELGAKYPGRFIGDLYHVTADGKPYKRIKEGRIFIEIEEIVKAAQMIRDMKGGGKLLVTPQGNIVTNIKGIGTVYLGKVDLSAIRNEVSLKLLSYNRPKKEKFSLETLPTFEELFGS